METIMAEINLIVLRLQLNDFGSKKLTKMSKKEENHRFLSSLVGVGFTNGGLLFAAYKWWEQLPSGPMHQDTRVLGC